MSSAIVRRRPTTIAPTHHQHLSQTRNFRISFWSSHLDPAFAKEMRRRARSLKHKDAEAINRRLQWDRNDPLATRRSGFKDCMCSAWFGSDSKPGGRYVNPDASGSPSSSSNHNWDFSVPPFRPQPWTSLMDIRNLHREWMNGAFEPSTVPSKPYSTSADGRNQPHRTASTSTKQPQSPQKSPKRSNQNEAEVEYDIDPITNRKVPRKTPKVEETFNSDSGNNTVKTSKPYREQFKKFRPPVFEEESSETTRSDGRPAYNDLKKYGPFRSYEPDGKYASASGRDTERGTGIENPSQDELKKYGPYRSHEPDGKYAPESELPRYEDLESYGPFKSHEPDGRYAPAQNQEPVYEDLDKYDGPFRAHEPDGKYAPEPNQEPVYEDLDKYDGPFRSHEPDGKYKPAQTQEQVYEDLDKYDGPFRAHEPDGKYAPEAQSRPQYEDLEDYGPFRAHEPNGKCVPAKYQVRKDLESHQPLRRNESDGKLSSAPDQVYDDLEDYPARSKDNGPFRAHEPDGNNAPLAKAVPRYDDLDNYGPIRAHKPDGKYALEAQSRPQYEDVDNYGPVRSHEPDGKYAPLAKSQPGYEDLESYGPVRVHEPDGKYASAQSQESYEDLESYRPYRYNEPDGKLPPRPDSVTESLKDFDTKQNYYHENAPNPSLKPKIPKVVKSSSATTKFEPSLPRPSQAKLSAFESLGAFEEEDFGILRASDVRAAVGISKKAKTVSADDKFAKREKLEKEFAEVEHPIHTPELEYVKTIRTGMAAKARDWWDGDKDNATQEKRKLLERHDAIEDHRQWIRIWEKLSVLARDHAENATALHISSLLDRSKRRAKAFLDKVDDERAVDGPEWAWDMHWLDKQLWQGMEIELRLAVADVPDGAKADDGILDTSEDVKAYESLRNQLRGGFSPLGRAVQPALENSWTYGVDWARERHNTTPSPKLETALDRSLQQQEEEPGNVDKTQAGLDPFSKEPQGLETNYKEEVITQTEIDPFSHKPLGLETSYAEEVKTEAEIDPFSHKPQGLETNYSEEVQREVEIDPFSHKPQGLEINYREEVATEAEIDPFSHKPQGLETNYAQEVKNEVEIDPFSHKPLGLQTSYAEEVRTEAEIDPFSHKPQGLETSYVEEVKTEAEIDPFSHKPQGLETNYSEEIKSQAEVDPFSDKPQGLETSYADEVNSKTANSPASASYDPYSKEPQGLETSYAEEVAASRSDSGSVLHSSYGTADKTAPGMTQWQKKLKDHKEQKTKDTELIREVRGIYESTYGTIDCQHRQVPQGKIVVDESAKPASASDTVAAIRSRAMERLAAAEARKSRQLKELQARAKSASSKTSSGQVGESAPISSSAESNASSAPSPEPTFYKVLAYDSAMQTINIAETPSTVHDSSTALTPAEALMRLSNPAKFFPHFQGLQAQGYEIISGSGDVLVFRKVRDGTPLGASVDASTSSTTGNGNEGKTVRNPVDGTEAPVGNFASPTGFVNHDVVSPEGEKPFVSNINVRREEPYFSGNKNWEDDSEYYKKRNAKAPLWKRVTVGAVGVGACSYAIGVVSEYFKTGGADGKGSEGF